MIRVVLDVNVIVSAFIRPSGPPGLIVAMLLRQSAFDLILSPEISDELSRTLKSPRIQKYLCLSNEAIALTVTQLELLADAVSIPPGFRPISRDPDDDKFIAAAIEGRADCIVSGDDDLLTLGEYENVRIMTPRSFLRTLEKPSPK